MKDYIGKALVMLGFMFFIGVYSGIGGFAAVLGFCLLMLAFYLSCVVVYPIIKLIEKIDE
jgi:hypothetical protein